MPERQNDLFVRLKLANVVYHYLAFLAPTALEQIFQGSSAR